VDFRANPRYRIGTFSDLKEVNEAGDYEQGSISDAERESITAKRKGRILVVSREMIVNDDLQAFADVARGLGAVANRTVDKDVFALFALNSGAGPTMGDGNPLFHASHNNIAARVRYGAHCAVISSICSLVVLVGNPFTLLSAFTAARSPMGNISARCRANIR